MSLLLLLGAHCPPENADGAGTGALEVEGNLQGMLDAIFKEDDRIGGRGVTKLTAELNAEEIFCMEVESTIGFGENNDGTTDARVLVGGEIIECTSRNSNDPFLFSGLTRGLENTEVGTYPPGTLVFDLSRNSAAIDHLRRGFFVDTAVGEDLRIIGRNLGIDLCPGLTEEQLRRIIKAIAYLPKQTVHAFDETLFALLEDRDLYTITELLVTRPWHVFVGIRSEISTDIRGRFLLNGGEPQLTTGLTSVVTDYQIGHVIGVYDDTPLTRKGVRDGFTNYATTGTFVSDTITLDVSPGAAGTPVIVDYGAFDAHYVAVDETVRQDLSQGDHWAYIADPLLTARCLLEQIRAAGVKVELSTVL